VKKVPYLSSMYAVNFRTSGDAGEKAIFPRSNRLPRRFQPCQVGVQQHIVSKINATISMQCPMYPLYCSHPVAACTTQGFDRPRLGCQRSIQGHMQRNELIEAWDGQRPA
jgi:hypothetical protein